MSHCCGGCGGEDPSKKKTEVADQALENKASENKADEKNAATEATAKEAEVGTWQPAGK
jgi:hypothetical protein